MSAFVLRIERAWFPPAPHTLASFCPPSQLAVSLQSLRQHTSIHLYQHATDMIGNAELVIQQTTISWSGMLEDTERTLVRGFKINLFTSTPPHLTPTYCDLDSAELFLSAVPCL